MFLYNKSIAYVTLVIVHLIYGANYVIAKGIMPDVIGPSGFVLARVTGAIVLFGILFLFVNEKVERKDKIRLALCAFFGVALNQLLFLNGLNLTSPINASILMISIPIAVIIFSYFMLEEKITPRKVIGILLGAIGAAYLILSSGTSDKNSSILGDVLCLINAVSYAFYLVLAKPLMTRYRPITVMAWIFLFGFIYVLPFGFNQFMEVDWRQLDGLKSFSILYVVICTTFLVYLLNIFALKIVRPTVVSIFTYLQPVFAGFFAWVYFVVLKSLDKEVTDYSSDITVIKIFCTILIFAGVYLVTQQRKKLL